MAVLLSAASAASVGSTLWAFARTWYGALVLYLALITLATFVIFGLDKWKAKRKSAHPSVRRVPERTLFLLAAAGGSVGALLGMKVFHHKTLHRSFRIGIPLILIAQLVLAGGLWIYFHSAW